MLLIITTKWKRQEILNKKCSNSNVFVIIDFGIIKYEIINQPKSNKCRIHLRYEVWLKYLLLVKGHNNKIFSNSLSFSSLLRIHRFWLSFFVFLALFMSSDSFMKTLCYIFLSKTLNFHKRVCSSFISSLFSRQFSLRVTIFNIKTITKLEKRSTLVARFNLRKLVSKEKSFYKV